ncbi:MAG TPA: PAS domain S-box protein [Acidimicrobiia bacterium]
MTIEGMVEHGLLHAVADGLLVCDEQGIIKAVNRRIEELSGYDSGELIGRSVEKLLPLSLRDQHEGHRAGFGTSGYPARPMGADLDTLLLRKDGSTLPVDIALAPLEVDPETLVVSAVRDATARVRQERSIRAMREVTETILKGRPPGEIYALICEQAVDLLRASVGLIAVRAERGEGFQVQAAAGSVGESLTGRLLTHPFWEAALGTEGWTTIDADFEHLSEALGHPIGPAVVLPIPEGQRIGFLLVADEPGCPPFDDDSLERLETFASQAGLAFAYGRRLRALAVAGDRDRIARDLHDVVIQRLFGAGLSLQVASQLFGGGEPALSQRLEEVTENIDAAIAELRRSIFDLERKDELGFRDQVLIAVEEVLADQDIRTIVKVDEMVAGPPDEKASHLLATLREALTNVGRHSSATEVDISVSIGPNLVLVVSDNGVGIGLDASMGHGLSNMAARARQLGGDLDVSNGPGGGLQLEWRVPL